MSKVATNYMKPWVILGSPQQVGSTIVEQYSIQFHTLLHSMESFNPRGETAYTVRGLNGNKVLEIASDFAMTLGEIHTHVHYLDHCSQTTSPLFWDENGAYHRSELRDDEMPNSKTGPLVPFGSTVQVVLLQAIADIC